MDKDLERIKERQSNRNSLESGDNEDESDSCIVADKDRIEVMYTNFEKQDDGKPCICEVNNFLVLCSLIFLNGRKRQLKKKVVYPEKQINL